MIADAVLCPVCRRHASSVRQEIDGTTRTRTWVHGRYSCRAQDTVVPEPVAIDKAEAAKSLDERIGRGA